MTPEEREQAVLTAIKAACAQYGCDLSVYTEVKRYGAMIQAEPRLQVQAIEDWHDESDNSCLPETGTGE